jgi:hypothetical protein
MLTLAVEREAVVEQWTWRDGTLHGPREIDASGLECGGGLVPGSFSLRRVAALHDDALRRAGDAGGGVSRILVGQSPCGTPEIRVSLEGGAEVLYGGDGYFIRVQ